MKTKRAINIIVSILMAVTIMMGSGQQVLAQSVSAPSSAPAALPSSPTDETKVPHYFGPNPNWALSPLTLPDVIVTITDPGGVGTGAAATATVGANGAVTGLTITSPGSGYTAANVTITSNNPAAIGATASAAVTSTGIVTSVTVTAPGAGFVSPSVAFSGGGATTQATAIAYGGVDAVVVSSPGSGYTMPTVEFGLPDDPNGVQATGHATLDVNAGIGAVIVDNPGSGYANAPTVRVWDGVPAAPINKNAGIAAQVRSQIQSGADLSGIAPAATSDAIVTATLSIQSVVPDTFGAGYTSAPAVTITDVGGVDKGAAATAAIDSGGVTSITLVTGGSGYLTPGGIQKFTDELPGLCNPAVAGSCPAFLTDANGPLAMVLQPKYIPLAVPDAKIYNGIAADEFDIALVQYRTNFSSSLADAAGNPVGTLVRGYVQLETLANAAISQHYPLANELLDGSKVPVMVNGAQAYGVTPPQYLGPVIAATKDKPVRIIFRNLLPTGSDGELFLPSDSSLMGSGMGPMNMAAPVNNATVMDEVRNPVCTEYPSSPMSCFTENRATLHLHGGTSPWISDGTAHQWITPANETTMWPQGVSVSPVPDMAAAGCDGTTDGCMTFYYTNQQSARLMFYHDHAWGITRLNVYAGEAAGYLISDATEAALTAPGAALDGLGLGIPLIIQDKTFVPQDAQLYNVKDATSGAVLSYGQDPTWNKSLWGGYGSLWYHHVYMPAQNPGDPSGMSAYGRWMYGPWFWPPATGTVYGPIANPYYNPACDLANPATWQYQTDPFCEPQEIPGTPNISVGMEQFNDTPLVNGVAYPTVTLQPQTYRFRMLNAANDRFFNFQWYVADPATASNALNKAGVAIGGTEVALKAAEVAAAQLDPVVFPTPDTAISLPGPDWVQIGSEGGFLPAPTIVDGQQVTTWITDPTRFDVGNVDLHSLLLAPAERADVVVDFSKFAGQTLILYNDAPAAFPARVPSYDYYTGYPDQSPNGPSVILPGYGPNTRTIMQVKIAAATPAPAFDQVGTLNDGLGKLQAAFKHNVSGTGVFESGQHPIIVGQAAYNSAYGKNFSPASNCNVAGSTLQTCDGFVRVNDTAQFSFNTLSSPTTKMTLPLEPKAIHDEMNSTTFDEYGRMQANLGVEAQPPTPGAQNVTLYPFVNPQTELIDATNLPKNDVVYDANGLPVSDVKIAPINAADGTQIWRITHNGVDTHPIHFHLYDVQIVNRVTWDNIIIPTEPGELGWKDTIRVSPLEDTIVALRPIIPEIPWELPNAIRNLNPMMSTGSTAMFFNTLPDGTPSTAITNQLVNFGWEYVYHCHILSHEEMDMMRPVSVAVPPLPPSGLFYTTSGTGNKARITISWTDNSISETSYLVQKSLDGTTWIDVGTSPSPLDQPNVKGVVRSLQDPSTVYSSSLVIAYRVVAQNTIGYGGQFPGMTAKSPASPSLLIGTAPAAPTALTASVQLGANIRLTWTDNAINESGFIIQRSINGGAPVQIAVAPARANTGSVTFNDLTVSPSTTYSYQVAAVNVIGPSAFVTSNTVNTQAAPAAATAVTAVLSGTSRASVQWSYGTTNPGGFLVQWSTSSNFAAIAGQSANLSGATRSYLTPTLARRTSYYFRVIALNPGSQSAPTLALSPVTTQDVEAPQVTLFLPMIVQ